MICVKSSYSLNSFSRRVTVGRQREVLADRSVDGRIHLLTHLRLHTMAHVEEHSEVEGDNDSYDEVQMPGAEDLFSFILRVADLRLCEQRIAAFRSFETFELRIVHEGCDLPGKFTLIRRFPIGLADGHGEVMARRICVRHIVHSDRWV